MTSEVRYEIKNFITCYLTWNIDTNLGWFVRNEHELRPTDPGDPVEDEMLKIRPRTDSPNVLQCDLKKRKNIIHSSWSIDHHFTLAMANNFNVITD